MKKDLKGSTNAIIIGFILLLLIIFICYYEILNYGYSNEFINLENSCMMSTLGSSVIDINSFNKDGSLVINNESAVKSFGIYKETLASNLKAKFDTINSDILHVEESSFVIAKEDNIVIKKYEIYNIKNGYIDVYSVDPKTKVCTLKSNCTFNNTTMKDYVDFSKIKNNTVMCCTQVEVPFLQFNMLNKEKKLVPRTKTCVTRVITKK